MNTLKPWWPGLFDGDTPRLLACGIRDVLLEDVAQRNIPLSHKKLRRALKAITRSESYLCAMKAGACRYDTEGYVTEHISQEEEAYAAARLDKIMIAQKWPVENGPKTSPALLHFFNTHIFTQNI